VTSTAVFLDRDGTVVEDPGYIGDPDQVQLLPDATDAINRFSKAGHLVVVVSNQSGVARGMFTEEDLSQVHDRFVELLEADGAVLDGAYYCPYLNGSEAKVEAYRRDSDLRKPKPGMLLQAARELGIDLTRSWMIGDAARDVEAGARAGCRTILVARHPSRSSAASVSNHTVRSLSEAADIVEREMVQENDSDSDDTLDRGGKTVRLLEEIRDRLDRAHREQRQQDFSFLRLLGALLQMFAIVAALWGVAALLGDETSSATARLTLACFLQLATIFAFAVSRWR